jgi:hypothetical protein
LLEKDNTEEILSTTAPIQIIKSEIVKWKKTKLQNVLRNSKMIGDSCLS